jgi:rubrerythrin
MGNLHIKTHSKFSLITIVNWGSFQAEPIENAQQNAQQMHNRCTTDAQQMHTNKNDKNDKNDKNGGYGVASNVVLSESEHGRLTDLMGPSTRDDYIDRLSTYDKIQKYKSHYLTILNWWKKDGGPKDKTPVDHITCPHCSQYMATFEIKNGKCPVCGKEISL